MAKSMRSKWKKAHKAIRAANIKPLVSHRVDKLHEKLVISTKGGIGKVPMQDACETFHHLPPTDVNPDAPLKLAPMKTNVRKGWRGHESGPPHHLTVGRDALPAAPEPTDTPVEQGYVVPADIKAKYAAQQAELAAIANGLAEQAQGGLLTEGGRVREIEIRIGDSDDDDNDREEEHGAPIVTEPQRLKLAKDRAEGAKKMKLDSQRVRRLVQAGGSGSSAKKAAKARKAAE